MSDFQASLGENSTGLVQSSASSSEAPNVGSSGHILPSGFAQQNSIGLVESRSSPEPPNVGQTFRDFDPTTPNSEMQSKENDFKSFLENAVEFPALDESEYFLLDGTEFHDENDNDQFN